MLARATLTGGHRAQVALEAVVARIYSTSTTTPWFDPSDLGTLYQDNWCMTPVTTVEQSVGYVIDKSKGGPTRGAEQVLNGGFDLGLTSWTTPVTAPGTVTATSAGTVVLDSGTANGGGIARLRQAITVTPGWYEVSFDVLAYAGATVNSQLALGSDTSGGAQYLALTVSSTGTVRRVFYVSTTTLGVAFFCSATTTQTVFTLDNFSIKALNGANVWIPTPAVIDANWTDNTGGSYTSNGGTGLVGWSGAAPKLTIGKTYEVTARVTARTSGSLFLPYDGAGPNNTAVAAAVGSYRRVFTATTVSLYIYSSAFNGTVDSILVQELPCVVNLNQVTSTARPVLSSRVNRFIATEDFTNAIWVKSGGALLTVNSNVFTAPDGTQTADELVQADAGNAQSIYQQFPDTVQTGVPLVCRVRVRAGTATTASLSLYDSTAGGHTASTCTIISGPGALAGSTLRAISGLTSAWTTIEFALAAPVAGNVHRLMIYPNVTSAGVAGMSIGIWGAQMEQASTASAYQRVNTATDYDWLGWPLYLRFDGVDDFLQTTTPAAAANLNLSATDKLTVVAGVLKASDVANGMIAELSDNLNNNNGTFYLIAPSSAGLPGVAFAAKGTSAVSAGTSAGFVAPTGFVLSGQGDIGTPRIIARANGAQLQSLGNSLGTGNFGSYPLYVGSRGGSSIRFNGRLYGLMLFDRLLTPDELFLSERYMGRKMGIAL